MAYSRISLWVLRTAAEWAVSTQVLRTNEAGIESDTGRVKQGNGLDLFSALSYLPCCGGSSPDAFDFTDQTGTARNTLIYSDTIALTGTAGDIWRFAVRSAAGNPMLSINGGTFVTEGIAVAGDTIQLSITSSVLGSTTRTSVLYFDGGSVDWEITTAAFIPTDISGLSLWLDAAEGVTKDGSDFVSLWEDQSGNSNDAAQASGGNKPLWVDTVLNSLPIMRFDGSNDWFTIANSVTIGTIFVVSKYDTTPFATQAGLIGVNAAVASAPYHILTGVAGTTSFYSNSLYSLLVSQIYNAGVLTDDYAPLTTWKITHGTANATYFPPTAFTNMHIARNEFNGAFWDGDIAEIICYDTVLSAPNIASVVNYLNTKYGL